MQPSPGEREWMWQQERLRQIHAAEEARRWQQLLNQTPCSSCGEPPCIGRCGDCAEMLCVLDAHQVGQEVYCARHYPARVEAAAKQAEWAEWQRVRDENKLNVDRRKDAEKARAERETRKAAERDRLAQRERRRALVNRWQIFFAVIGIMVWWFPPAGRVVAVLCLVAVIGFQVLRPRIPR